MLTTQKTERHYRYSSYRESSTPLLGPSSAKLSEPAKLNSTRVSASTSTLAISSSHNPSHPYRCASHELPGHSLRGPLSTKPAHPSTYATASRLQQHKENASRLHCRPSQASISRDSFSSQAQLCDREAWVRPCFRVPSPGLGRIAQTDCSREEENIWVALSDLHQSNTHQTHHNRESP